MLPLFRGLGTIEAKDLFGRIPFIIYCLLVFSITLGSNISLRILGINILGSKKFIGFIFSGIVSQFPFNGFFR